MREAIGFIRAIAEGFYDVMMPLCGQELEGPSYTLHVAAGQLV